MVLFDELTLDWRVLGVQVLCDILRRQMMSVKRRRWSVIKYAIVHGDEGLVSLLLSDKVKVLPYVLNPTFLEKLSRPDELQLDHELVRLCSEASEDLVAGPGVPLLHPHSEHRPHAAVMAPHLNRDARRGVDVSKPDALITDESLLHIAIAANPPRLGIVRMLLEYSPSDEEIQRQLMLDKKELQQCVIGFLSAVNGSHFLYCCCVSVVLLLHVSCAA